MTATESLSCRRARALIAEIAHCTIFENPAHRAIGEFIAEINHSVFRTIKRNQILSLEFASHRTFPALDYDRCASMLAEPVEMVPALPWTHTPVR